MRLGTWEPEGSWREQLTSTLSSALLLLLSITAVFVYLAASSPRVVSVFSYVFVPVLLVLALERLWLRRSWRARAQLTIGGLVVCAVAGVTTTGLLAGSGGALIVALVLSALLLGMRMLWIVLGIEVCSVAAVAGLMLWDVLPLPLPSDMSFSQGRIWLRTGSAMLVVATLAGIAVARVVEHLERALVRVREESAQREQAQRERTRALELALHSQKLELIGRLAASFAHDVNNSLLVISACSEVLGDRGLSEADRKETHETIASAVQQASSLTGQLLSLSRKRIASPTRLSMQYLGEELRKTLSHLLPADVTFAVERETDASVHADALQLQQAILNLALNARDAMPAGGCLTVRIREVEVDAPLPCVGGEIPRGRFVALEVHDTGSGMDAKTAAQAFELLFTTKPEGKGTGLGLASVLATVQAGGGHVTLWSEPARGTRIALYLPIDAAPTAEAAAPSQAVPDLSGTTVLVADDSAEALRVMHRTLSGAGCTVLQARDGTHMLELVERSQARIDVLCTDAIMPGTPVREVLFRLRELHPETAVLVVSGYVADELLRRGIEQGVYRVLAKPFSAEQLLHAVGELSRRELSGPLLGATRPEGPAPDATRL